MSRQKRRGRRSDGLYQARLHQRIQRQIEDRQEAREPLSFEKLFERAWEAKNFKCDHTFLHPDIMLHLLELRGRYLKLRGLIEGHWATAQEEQKSGYSDRDLFLWTQALRWHERKNE